MKARSVVERYDRGNLEAAAIILNDPVKFPPGSGGQQWAEAFMRRRERERQAKAERLFRFAN